MFELVDGYPGTIIGDSDNDGLSIGIDAYADEAEFVLTEHPTHLGRLDAVDNGVLDEVQQRLERRVENKCVDLGVGRLDVEKGFLFSSIAVMLTARASRASRFRT